MRKLLLIDGNSIGYASINDTKLMAGEQETTAIYGFLKTLSVTMRKFPDYEPQVLWDGHAQFRYDIFTGYKDRTGKDAKSDDRRKRWKDQREHVKQVLTALNVTQFMHPDYEADDLACQFADIHARNGNQIVLVTGDKDWFQILQPNVVWYEHRDNTVVTHDQLFKITGFKTPETFVAGKALMGDTSDTIPGVGGVGKTGAQNLLAEFGSVKAFREAVQQERVKKVSKTLQRLVDDEPFEYRKKQYPAPSESYRRNIRLVDLRRAPKVTTTMLEVTKLGRLDREAFANKCEEYAFASILTTMDDYLVPFQQWSN